MRTWTRAGAEIRCGGPNHAAPHFIKAGEPVMFLKLRAGDPRPRCVHCAGEPVPADLPDKPITSAELEPMQPLAGVARSLPFDYKREQLGEREPGADDV